MVSVPSSEPLYGDQTLQGRSGPVAPEPSTSLNFGHAVDVFGNIITVGAPNFDMGTTNALGAVYVFDDISLEGDFSELRQTRVLPIQTGVASTVRFGMSVSIDGDTNKTVAAKLLELALEFALAPANYRGDDAKALALWQLEDPVDDLLNRL